VSPETGAPLDGRVSEACANILPPMVKRSQHMLPEPIPLDSDLPDDPSHLSLKQWGEFARNSVRRRPWRWSAVLAAGLCLTTLFFELRTPLYRVETKVLTQRQQAMPSISRSAMSDEAPTRTANELIRRKENLVFMLEHAGLLPLKGVVPPPSLLTRIMNLGSPPRTEEEAVNALVLNLDRALTVTTGDGTVTISLDWPDPRQAYSLVQGALQNFLEARQLQEITAVDEAISLLQSRTAELRGQLEAAMRDAQRTLPRGPSLPSSAPQRSALPAQPSETLVRLRSSLDATSRSISDLENLRSRRLAELQGQLNERRSVYSEAHPMVAALKGEIASLSGESAQLKTLREEEARLQEEYDARVAIERSRGAPSASLRASGASSNGTAAGSGAATAALNEDERVRDARFRYTQMVDRLNAAQLDLDSARAAFKHRYSVLWPAQMPSRPVSPNPLKVFGVGVFLSLLLAVAAVALPDLSTGRILESSQIERSLGIPVLATMSRTSRK
jgi:uncharacterized protein involved in exopolysaccharide biosynthesis